MKRVTIKDIALLAGVSYATVSRALSGSKEISQATRARILAICDEQGYRANALARGLTQIKTNVLGLIVPDITNPFYSEVSLGIERHAYQQGYNLMLCNNCHGKTTAELFDFLISHQVDGIIFASSDNDAPAWVRKYAATLPVVLLGDSFHSVDGGGVNAVSIDNRAGGRMGAEYLLQLGHRDIMYLGFRPASIAHQHRYEGFCAAMAEAGLPVHTLENHDPSSSIASGCTLGRRLFAEGFSGSAVFAATDSIALGVLQAADEFGIAIPEQLSLLGFDNLIYASLPKIGLSTIDQRKPTLAEASVNLLTELIDRPSREEYTRRLIRPMLVTRSSCGEQTRKG